MNSFVLGKLREWRHSPLLFVRECIRANPSDQQAELLHAFVGGKKFSVRSGHGTGKDAEAAWLIAWFLTTNLSLNVITESALYPKVVCTAPTAHQLADILWSEVAKWLRQSLVGDEFIIQKDKIFQKDNPKEWWCVARAVSARASKDEQAETIAGFHNENLLIVVDEASGMPDPVFVPLEGALTQENNKVLLIGNMTKDKGYFYDTHFHSEISKSWTKFHWDSRKSTNVNPAYPEYMATKYGILSNVFRIRVAGDPPLADEKTFIPLAWAMQCIGNDVEVPEDEPLYLSVDVARYGEDDSIIMPGRGNLILPWATFNGLNIITLAGHVQTFYVESDAEGVAIDEIGIGAGVVDWLEKKNLPGLYGVNVALESSDITKFHRLRDELWARVREKCMVAKYSFPDIILAGDSESLGQMLANELSCPTYDFNAEGGFVIESKKKMKARGIASPNIADALCLREYFFDSATKIWPKEKKIRKVKRSSIHTGTSRVYGTARQKSRVWVAN